MIPRKSILATLITAALAAAPAFADSADKTGAAEQPKVTGKANDAYVGDSGGNLISDSSGKCVQTSSWSRDQALPQCDPNAAPPVARAPESAETSPRTPVASAPPPSEKITLSDEALFAFDQATINAETDRRLDELVTRLQGLDQVERVVIVGHADSIGTNEYNKELSQRRAESVKRYLEQKGIAPERVDVRAMGEAQPVAPNSTSAGRAQNRRVEIEILGETEGSAG
jgi:OOP family OmpA-OmpF porin